MRLEIVSSAKVMKQSEYACLVNPLRGCDQLALPSLCIQSQSDESPGKRDEYFLGLQRRLLFVRRFRACSHLPKTKFLH